MPPLIREISTIDRKRITQECQQAAWYLLPLGCFYGNIYPILPVINTANFSQAAESNRAVVLPLWAVWEPASHYIDAWLRQDHDSYKNLHFYATDIDQE